MNIRLDSTQLASNAKFVRDLAAYTPPVPGGNTPPPQEDLPQIKQVIETQKSSEGSQRPSGEKDANFQRAEADLAKFRKLIDESRTIKAEVSPTSYSVQFKIEDGKPVITTVVDAVSGDVIKQIPPEVMLQVSDALRDTAKGMRTAATQYMLDQYYSEVAAKSPTDAPRGQIVDEMA